MQHWPKARSVCVETLTKQLELFEENDPEVNSFLVLSLARFHATEVLPLVERAYAAGCVDFMLLGGWDDAQFEFGVLSEEEVEERRSRRLFETPSFSPTRKTIHPQVSVKESHQRAATQKKTKSKMAKQSRKKNRKR